MKFLFVLCAVLAALSAQARVASVACYDNDSLSGPSARDCEDAPNLDISESGELFVDGRSVFNDRFDRVVQAKASPKKIVAFRTEKGSIYVWENKKVTRWFEGWVTMAADFKMNSTGNIMAVSREGYLIRQGKVYSNINKVKRLYAAPVWTMLAQMEDGSVVDEQNVVYDRRTDPVERLEVAEDGWAAWITAEGRLIDRYGRELYRSPIDAVASMKFSGHDFHVAYLTAGGKLGRDGKLLDVEGARVVTYAILMTGEVIATDVNGRHYVFACDDECRGD